MLCEHKLTFWVYEGVKFIGMYQLFYTKKNVLHASTNINTYNVVYYNYVPSQLFSLKKYILFSFSVDPAVAIVIAGKI